MEEEEGERKGKMDQGEQDGKERQMENKFLS